MANVIEVRWAPKEAEQLGKWLQNERESRSWTRGQLAQRMGYRNIGRGGSRIADWEKGLDIPRGDRVDVLKRALQIDGEPLTRLVESFYQASAANKAAHQEGERKIRLIEICELKLLVKHHALLMREARRILAQPDWANIRIVGARVHAAYLGGSTLTLGGLLESWLNDRGVTEQPDGHHYILSCSGSPLSGRYSALIFGPNGALTTIRGPKHKTTAMAFMIHNLKSKDRPASQWSLGQLLASFGVEVADIEIFSPEGEEIGRYNHDTRCFYNTGGSVDLSILFEKSLANARWNSNWKDTGISGRRILIGQLSPPRRGIWKGDRLTWTDSKGQVWHGTPGLLEERQGGRAIRINNIAPPPLLAWLVEHHCQ